MRETLVIFEVLPGQVNAVNPVMSGQAWEYRSALLSDFLARTPAPLPKHLDAELRSARPAQRIHWIEVAGVIGSWGFSTPAVEPWPLSETKSHLEVPPDGVYLTSFETLPVYRGRRLYPAILSRILEDRFRDGAQAAYIWCRQRNVASYRAIKRVGFHEMARHCWSRLLGVSWHSQATFGR